LAHFFKIVVLGDGGIGKTSLCNYLTTGEFFGSYKLSIGADFFSKKLTVDGIDVTLQICDIGGQDQFAEISNIFTKGAHGAILCYDITRRDTLDSLTKWIGKLEDPNIPKVLVSTKNDVEELREVEDAEGLKKAQELNIPYYIPTTSLKGIGITETFEAISRVMIMNEQNKPLPESIMIDVCSPQQPEVHTISGSQHISAQPLGIGRMPAENSSVKAPMAPSVETQPVEAPIVGEQETEEKTAYQPPIVQEATEAKPSFTEPITLKPPTTQEVEQQQPKSTTQDVPLPNINEPIEPPTEPEKTVTQPLSSITPPLSEQQRQEDRQQAPEITPETPRKETEPKSRFSFLDRLKEEQKRIIERKEQEEEE
jgi:small GTP-binding protein